MDSLSPQTTLPIIHCTDHTPYINHGLSLPLCRVLFSIYHSPSLFARVWMIAFVFLNCPFRLCLPLFGLLLEYSDYPYCQALWTLFADRRPTHALRLLLCLALNMSVYCCLTLPVLDHVSIKALSAPLQLLL